MKTDTVHLTFSGSKTSSFDSIHLTSLSPTSLVAGKDGFADPMAGVRVLHLRKAAECCDEEIVIVFIMYARIIIPKSGIWYLYKSFVYSFEAKVVDQNGENTGKGPKG